MELKPIAITSFKGLNEVSDPLNHEAGTLAACSNVMLTDAGGLKSRSGYTQASTGHDEAYFTRDGERAFVCTAGVLSRLHPDGSLTTIASGLPEGRLYWAELGDQVIISGAFYGVLRGDVFSLFLGRAQQPMVGKVAGNLPAGNYMVVAGRSDDSPVSLPVHVTLTGQEGLTVAPVGEDGEPMQVFVTSLNGEIPYYLGTVEVGGAIEVREGFPSMPVDADRLKASEFPPATRVAWFQSRVWRAQFDQGQNTTFLYPSGVFRPNLCMVEDYLAIPGEVTMLAATDEELVIGTTARVYVFNGNTMDKVMDRGCPDHKQVAYDAEDRLWFWTHNGMAQASPVKGITYDTLRTVDADRVSVQRLRDPQGDQIVAIFSKSS